jgi:DNA repair protein RecO (recombination protein O)
MLVKTDGIILRQIPFSETSIIVKIFTRDYGLVSFLVKGAKSKKNPRANILKPINQVSISYYKKDTKGLRQLKECQLIFAPDAQQFGIYKSSIAMMMVELLNTTITEDEYTDAEKYNFIEHSFQYLIDHELNSNFYLSFLYQYSIYLGIELPISIFTNSDQAFILSDYTTIQQIKLIKSDRKNMFKKIEQHYFENLTNYKSLRSIDIIEEIIG